MTARELWHLPTEYVHILDGRIRVKLGSLKGSQQGAQAVTDLLLKLPGVHVVRANPTTGSLLIWHDPKAIGPQEISLALHDAGYGDREISNARARKGLSETFLRSAANATVETAIERLLIAIL